MYAIVEIAGQQYKVEKDQEIFVHRLEGKEGSKVDFHDVLMIDNKGKVVVGSPHITGAAISAKILEHTKGDKILVFKKKRRKGYQKLNGHRQYLTRLQITNIAESGAQPKAKAEAKPAAKPKAEVKPATKPKAEKKPAAKPKTAATESKAAAKPKAAPKATTKAADRIKEAEKPAVKKPAAKKPATKSKATGTTSKTAAKPKAATKTASKPAAKKTTKPVSKAAKPAVKSTTKPAAKKTAPKKDESKETKKDK